jgi:hypothetical protein
MEMVTGAADRQGSGMRGRERVGVCGRLVDRRRDIDVGETAVVHVGKTPPSSELSEDHRTVA